MTNDSSVAAFDEKNKGFWPRIRRALPPLCDVKRGALVWSLAMLASSLVGHWLLYRGISGKEAALTAIFFVGGLFAWPFALFFARLLALGTWWPVRFVVSLASITGCTLAMTAFLFSQQYRSEYSAWHQPIYTRDGIHQFVETSASAVYQFLVIGIHLYYPLGILSFLLASLWLARRMR